LVSFGRIWILQSITRQPNFYELLAAEGLMAVEATLRHLHVRFGGLLTILFPGGRG
jgi:hypothetical protein